MAPALPPFAQTLPQLQSHSFLGSPVAVARARKPQQARRKTVSTITRFDPKASTKAAAVDAAEADRTKTPVKAQTFNVTLGFNEDRTLRKAPVTLGFTKDNELFVGRAAMVGVAASLLGEIVSGRGALAQLGMETGLPLNEIDGFLLALIAFNFAAALAPTDGKYVQQEDFSDRSKGVLQDPSISLLQPHKFFGTSPKFGFTKRNELFVGRLAQLGFAASLLGEALTGKGILGQIGLELGIPVWEVEPLLLFSILFTLFATANPTRSGRFTYNDDDEWEMDDE